MLIRLFVALWFISLFAQIILKMTPFSSVVFIFPLFLTCIRPAWFCPWFHQFRVTSRSTVNMSIHVSLISKFICGTIVKITPFSSVLYFSSVSNMHESSLVFMHVFVPGIVFLEFPHRFPVNLTRGRCKKKIFNPENYDGGGVQFVHDKTNLFNKAHI